jgi:hypothetical protein
MRLRAVERRSISLLRKLVSCPRNSMHFAGGQLAVFQGANERPYLTHTRRVSNSEKQPTGHGPTGCDENGPAAALLVGYVSIEICALLAPCQRPILIATKYMLFRGQDTNADDERSKFGIAIYWLLLGAACAAMA